MTVTKPPRHLLPDEESRLEEAAEHLISEAQRTELRHRLLEHQETPDAAMGRDEAKSRLSRTMSPTTEGPSALTTPRNDDIEQAWNEEIARRIAHIDRGEVQMLSNAEVLARIGRTPRS